MSPLPALIGIKGLSQRWGISIQASRGWTDRADFPRPEPVEGTDLLVWARVDVERWEQARRDDGQPLPGERPRGPQPGLGGR